MRLISYRLHGAERVGARQNGSLIDLSAAHAALLAERGAGDTGLVPASIVGLLAGGEAALAAAREAVEFAHGRDELIVDEDAIELLPVVPRPPKIICVARNYGEHAAEANLDVLERPNLFIRFPQSIVAHGDPVLVPRVSDKVDWEAELAVVIGKAGKHVAREDAYDHVAGYSLFNDVSVRDWQLAKPPIQFGAGKNFDGSGPFGPELVTRDEIADPQALDISLEVNGEVMQSSNTKSMIFDIPSLIALITQFTTLEPGDVIATGTPSGVGHFKDPPVYLKPGDTVRVVIEGIGTLENPVVAE
jgi:2-keto-4-pentenoate hydratase/2-oxohepta-3-ene-1,7-dioic acid hydratase in catechol pathway